MFLSHDLILIPMSLQLDFPNFLKGWKVILFTTLVNYWPSSAGFKTIQNLILVPHVRNIFSLLDFFLLLIFLHIHIWIFDIFAWKGQKLFDSSKQCYLAKCNNVILNKKFDWFFVFLFLYKKGTETGPFQYTGHSSLIFVVIQIDIFKKFSQKLLIFLTQIINWVFLQQTLPFNLKLLH